MKGVDGAACSRPELRSNLPSFVRVEVEAFWIVAAVAYCFRHGFVLEYMIVVAGKESIQWMNESKEIRIISPMADGSSRVWAWPIDWNSRDAEIPLEFIRKEQ